MAFALWRNPLYGTSRPRVDGGGHTTIRPTHRRGLGLCAHRSRSVRLWVGWVGLFTRGQPRRRVINIRMARQGDAFCGQPWWAHMFTISCVFMHGDVEHPTVSPLHVIPICILVIWAQGTLVRKAFQKFPPDPTPVAGVGAGWPPTKATARAATLRRVGQEVACRVWLRAHLF